MSLTEKLAKLNADVEELKAAAEDVRADLAAISEEIPLLQAGQANPVTAIDWQKLVQTIMQIMQMLLPMLLKADPSKADSCTD